jgi:hypothetical protein
MKTVNLKIVLYTFILVFVCDLFLVGFNIATTLFDQDIAGCCIVRMHHAKVDKPGLLPQTGHSQAEHLPCKNGNFPDNNIGDLYDPELEEESSKDNGYRACIGTNPANRFPSLGRINKSNDEISARYPAPIYLIIQSFRC